MAMGFAALLALGMAHAQAPQISPTAKEDGTVHTVVILPANVDAVRRQLEDPIAAAKLSPDITSIEYVSRGVCETLRVQTGSIAGMSYDYRRCPTADGWHETLVSSSGLQDYDVRWALSEVAEGTRVEYDVRIETSFPAPRFVVFSMMKDSVSTVLGRLYRAVMQR